MKICRISAKIIKKNIPQGLFFNTFLKNNKEFLLKIINNKNYTMEKILRNFAILKIAISVLKKYGPILKISKRRFEKNLFKNRFFFIPKFRKLRKYNKFSKNIDVYTIILQCKKAHFSKKMVPASF
jgi:hypothetical protein